MDDKEREIVEVTIELSKYQLSELEDIAKSLSTRTDDGSTPSLGNTVAFLASYWLGDVE